MDEFERQKQWISDASFCIAHVQFGRTPHHSTGHDLSEDVKMSLPEIDPIIGGLLKRLPETGDVWPEADRKFWLQLLEGSLRLIYKDAPEGLISSRDILETKEAAN